MNSIVSRSAATALASFLVFHPQFSSAEEFTGSDFLQRSTEDQRGYISTQLVMASTIAARTKPKLAECIASEFFGDGVMSELGFETVIGRIEEFSEYHPSSVLVIVIENACGAFN